MKVGIVTVYDSQNIGSFLQAFALQEFVRSNGDEPFVIQTRSEKTAKNIFLGRDRDTLKKNPKLMLRYTRNYLFRHDQITQRELKFENYKKDWKRLNIVSVEKANELGLDLVLFGSDEIWNVNVPAFEKEIMYGGGINARIKAGYAVSAGHAVAKDFKSFPGLVRQISGLDSILVRDDHTAELLKSFGLSADGKVFDPTLQIRLTDCLGNGFNIPDENYILIYSYLVPEEIRGCIRKFAEEKGLKTVAVSLYHDWCDEYINCSPLEIGAVFTKAKYVYTSTFHGTILSLLYHKQVAAAGEKKKVVELLTALGMEELLIDKSCTPEGFSEKLGKKPDYEALERRLSRIREESVGAYSRIKELKNG